MSKKKVLVIRKTDGTIHQVPVENKAKIMSLNNKMPKSDQWSIEEISEEEAAKLPFIDKDYVTGAEAQVKVKDLESEISDKDALIARLEKQLADKNGEDKKLPAVEVVEKINAATTVQAVQELSDGDDRATVTKAAEKKILELTGGGE